jgi:hypothetical protein
MDGSETTAQESRFLPNTPKTIIVRHRITAQQSHSLSKPRSNELRQDLLFLNQSHCRILSRQIVGLGNLTNALRRGVTQ